MGVKGIKGIIVPIVTPMDESGAIDIAGARRLLSHVIDGGVAGVFALGSTGEFSSLTLAEKVKFIRLVAAEINSRVPLFVGVSSTCDSEMTALMNETRASGGDAVVALPPYYFPFPNQDSLAEYFEDLADKAPLPLFLYNNSGYGKPSPLTVTTVARLAKHQNIIGIKEVTGFTNLMSMVAAVADQTAAGKPFGIFAGDDFQMTANVCLGAQGGVNSLANVAPDLYVGAFKLADARNLPALGHVTERGSYMARILALHDLYPVPPNAISAIKAALSVLGVCGAAVARPLQPVGPNGFLEVRAVLTKVGLI